jgi:biopolymer transport protein ExbD
MKYLSLVILFIILSCGNKEDILLPKSNVTVVADVKDHSPIYIFFRTNGKDTLAEVNRKNSIITTNWILNIDKRLPLRVVIPEVIILQDKKRQEKAHKNEKAENYYSYADSIGKNMAFIPFTKVYYKMEKPFSGNPRISFYKDKIQVNDSLVSKAILEDYLNNMRKENDTPFILCFDKNSSYGSYIQNKIFIKSIKLNKKLSFDDNQEFVF